MSTYAHRFVGLESLPSRLSDFDLEQFFQLTKDDIKEIGAQFRVDHRAPAALMVLFLRAAGRPLDHFAMLPRNLLRYVGERFKTAPPTIASLRAIYRRSQTLYKHQLWAKNYLGLQDIDADAEHELTAMLRIQATEASHTDDLVNAAHCWLYDQRILIPGERRVQDWAREAFAAVEADILKTIATAVPAATFRQVRESVYRLRPDGVANHLEWLKTPPKRHGPGTFGELLEKIRFLKSLGVHEWQLDGVALPKQRAYAQQVQARRPVKTREIKDAQQAIELVCFLHVSLLEFTDIAVQQGSRRSQQLFREAAKKAQTIRARAESVAREHTVRAREILRDKTKSWRSRCKEADGILTELLETPQGSFLSHVRRALSDDHQRVKAFLNGMLDLGFGGEPEDAGVSQWTAWRNLQHLHHTKLPAGFPIPEVGTAWNDLVHDPDSKRGLQAFAACTMMSLRKSLRSGKAWIDHSLSFRERDQMLIPVEEWNRDRGKYTALLGLPATADEFLEPQLELLKAGVAAVAEACVRGDAEIGTDGMLHLPAIVARPDDGEPRQTREMIYKMIGDVQFPDILLEMDAQCNFSEVLLGHRAQSETELLALYAGLFAHGKDLDAKNIASMIPGIEPAHVSVAMRALETHGRLRRANERIVDFQGRIPIAAQWGSGEKASADMMALDASGHLWNARVDPRRRTYAIGAYTHVIDRWGIVYDQPIVLNERQAGVAIEGVERYNCSHDRIRLSLLAVDTHGYTNPAMMVAKGLGFDLCPRLRDLAERKLYLPAGFLVPEGIERVTSKRLSLRAIRLGYDAVLRLIASVRIGRISADQALRFLSSAAQGDPMYRAADHLGRLLRSIFLCDYITIEDFRREIHTLLSRGESVHQLQRAILPGKVPAERGRRRDEMKAISGSHALLTNIVIAWNTGRMNDVVERLRKSGTKIEDTWLRRIGPAHFSHINFRGIFRFGVDKYAQALIRQASSARREVRTSLA